MNKRQKERDKAEEEGHLMRRLIIEASPQAEETPKMDGWMY